MIAAGSSPATRLETPEDFDYARLLGFLGPRSVPSMEITRTDAYVRTVWLERGALRALGASNAMKSNGFDVTGAITLAIVPGAADAKGRRHLTLSSAPALPETVLRLLVTRMFDLDADLDAFATAVGRDRVLGPLVRRHARLRLPQLLDPFEGLVRAVLGQQVSVKGATTMVDRVVRRLGFPAPRLDVLAADAAANDSRPLLAFPRPHAILDEGEATLRSLGLTRAKAATIVGLARAANAGVLDCVALRTCGADEAQAALVALPGIGPWTASYVRMRALGDRDAFPVTDLGVIKALDARGVPRDRHAIVAERWRPWRAYATLHLWESLASAAGVNGKTD